MFLNGRIRTADVHGTVDSFAKLVLPATLRRALAVAGYETPSPVQELAIPLARLGSDLVVQAKSGTGKTLVFALACIERVDPTASHPQALVICPTRELAQQCAAEITKLANHLPAPSISCGVFIGGVPVAEDRRRLRRACQVIVGTPGRLCDLIRNEEMDLSGLALVVTDEADQLLGASLRPSVESILRSVPEGKQFLAFSATYSDEILSAVEGRMRHPQRVLVSGTSNVLLGVRQCYRLIDETHCDGVFAAKSKALMDLLNTVSFHQAVVFCNLQSDAESLAERLTRAGFPAAFVSGLKPQEERTQTMEAMRDFELRVIVSTDLVARGVDLERVNLVANLDLPSSSATYQHRVGRTGRFGTNGIAVSLVTESELECLDTFVSAAGGEIQPLPDQIPEEWYAYELNKPEDKKAFSKLLEAPVVPEPLRHFDEHDSTKIGAAEPVLFDFWREWMGKRSNFWNDWDPFEQEKEKVEVEDPLARQLSIKAEPIVEPLCEKENEPRLETMEYKGLCRSHRIASVSSFGVVYSEEGGMFQQEESESDAEEDVHHRDGRSSDLAWRADRPLDPISGSSADTHDHSFPLASPRKVSLSNNSQIFVGESDSGALDLHSLSEMDDHLQIRKNYHWHQEHADQRPGSGNGSRSGSQKEKRVVRLSDIEIDRSKLAELVSNESGSDGEYSSGDGLPIPTLSNESIPISCIPPSQEVPNFVPLGPGASFAGADQGVVGHNVGMPADPYMMYNHWLEMYNSWAGAYRQWYEEYSNWCWKYEGANFVQESSGNNVGGGASK